MKKFLFSISLLTSAIAAVSTNANAYQFHLSEGIEELESSFYYQAGLRQGRINAERYYGSFDCLSSKAFPVKITMNEVTNNPYLYGQYKAAIETFEGLRLENLSECINESDDSHLGLENAIKRYKEVAKRISSAIEQLLDLGCSKMDSNIFCSKEQVEALSDYHSISMFFVDRNFVPTINKLTENLNAKLLKKTDRKNRSYLNEIRDLLDKKSFTDQDLEGIRQYSQKLQTTSEVKLLNEIDFKGENHEI